MRFASAAAGASCRVTVLYGHASCRAHGWPVLRLGAVRARRLGRVGALGRGRRRRLGHCRGAEESGLGRRVRESIAASSEPWHALPRSLESWDILV